MSKFLTLFRVTALFYIAFGFASITVAHADQVQATSTCTRLLSPTSFTQSKPSSEEVNWAEAYLSLLNLVLEGIDEIAADAFGHADRVQVKTQVLNNLIASKIPISPLVESQSQNLALDSTRPATPRNLINFSPKLSTLADSGQLEVVTENLSDSDWQYIRQAVQQLLSQLQNIQTAQATARPITQEDFEDISDANGNSRLHRLLLKNQLEEALQLVTSSQVNTRYINRLNKKWQTALDLLNIWASPQATLPGGVADQLRQALLAKNAQTSDEMMVLENLLNKAAEIGDLLEIQVLYDLGVRIFLSNDDLINFSGRWGFNWKDNGKVDSNSALHVAVRAGHIKTIKLLIALGSNLNSWNENGLTPLMEATCSGQRVEVIKALLVEGFDIESRRIEANSTHFTPSETSFLMAARCGRTDVMQLLMDHGANVNALSYTRLHALHLLAHTDNFSEGLQFLISLKNKNVFNYGLESIGHNDLTPLMYAVIYENLGLVKALLELGADPFRVGPYPVKFPSNKVGLTEKQKAIRRELLKYMVIWKARTTWDNLKSKISKKEKP